MPSLNTIKQNVTSIWLHSDTGVTVGYLDEDGTEQFWRNKEFFHWNFSIIGRMSGENKGIRFRIDD